MKMNKMSGQHKLSVLKIAIWLSSAMLATIASNSVSANQTQQTWDDWQAIGQGYVARRKVPANFDKDVSERQSADVVNRNSGIRSNKSKSNGKANSQAPFSSSSQFALSEPIDSIWIKTQGDGVFSVPIAEISSMTGYTEAEIVTKAKKRRLTLTNDDEAIRWMYYPDTESIIFIGEGYETFFAEYNAYHLTLRRTTDSKRITISNNRNGPNNGDENAFSEALSFEQEPDFFWSLSLVADEPDADYWFWDYLYSQSKQSMTLPLTVPNPALIGTAQIRVTLRGGTDLNEGDDHEVYAVLNGTPIGQSVVWDGFDEALLVADFDQSLLNENGENQLVLQGVYPSGEISLQWLDQVDIDYDRLPVAEDGLLLLSGLEKQTDQLVTGFTSEEILVIQNPNGTPFARRDVTIFEEADGSFSVAFNTKNATEYMVSQVNAALAADSLEEDIESDLANSSNSVDYLIIAPRVFAETAEALQSYRQSSFANIQIAWLDDVYDEFSAGRVDPFALTRFLDYVNTNWSVAPSNVVILGKGSLDHKDRMGYGDSFVPTVMTDTPWALAASDDRLLAGEGVAGFAIGRIPITNNTQGLNYVNKLIAYEQQSASFNAVLVADNPDEAGDFITNSDLLADNLVNNLGFVSVQKEYHPKTPSVQSQMLLDATWNSGLVNYDGHGSATQVGDGSENFVKASDAANLSNTTLPVFAALTCSAGDFSFPGLTSLAGALVLNPNGGAAVAYAPTGLSLDYDAQLLGNAFYDSLYGNGNTIGMSVVDAKYNTALTAQPFMHRIYSVVGDPAAYAR